MTVTRELNRCPHRFTKSGACRRCGQYQYRSEALKTTSFAAPFHFNLEAYHHTLRQTSATFVEPKELAEDAQQLLAAICEKFTFTQETLALGVYLYQRVKDMSQQQKFWSATALVLAGKAVELDKNVPYLNRYQRYADKAFSQEDYEQAERAIFDAVGHSLHHATFVTFLDFFLTCGVLFKDDAISEPLVEFFQDDVKSRAKEFLRRGTFTRYEPEKLALAIIREIRGKYSLRGWCQHLEGLSGFREEELPYISSAEGPLKERSVNNAEAAPLSSDAKTVRKRFESMISMEKGGLEKYSTAGRVVSKENLSSTRLVHPVRKHYFPLDNLPLTSELLKRR